MKLEFHRYRLRSRAEQALNAQSTRLEFPGALIRVDAVGVGCIHPWPELGDAPLDDQLASIASGEPLLLGRCALECAQRDGDARQAGRSLFDDLVIPPSHWTAGWTDDPAVVAAEGFKVAKLKLGPDIESAATEVARWQVDEARGIERLRLDFNESLEAEDFAAFWDLLDPGAREAIEFIEDPIRFDADEWRRLSDATGARFALDRAAGQGDSDWPGPVICKAAKMTCSQIDEILSDKESTPVFTSYMDHAIGQLWAAWNAARCTRHAADVEAGLLSHERFAPDPFFEALKREGPLLRVPTGTGLGFDKLLEDLTWTPLN